MNDALERILADKKEHVGKAKTRHSLATLESLAATMPPTRGFAARLDETARDKGVALIAEIKKASPSAGLIRSDFDPASLATAYRDGGAACLSVLTDEPWFQGRNDFLTLARGATGLPTLRKDFMIDPWQIVESRTIGADCVLLILAALSDALAAEMEGLAQSWGMDVLIEVHDEREFERALGLSSPLIGVNNRNLSTLVTDIATTERLAPRLPPGRTLVAESGIGGRTDLLRLRAAGARRFLIGESLMRAPDLAKATRDLLS